MRRADRILSIAVVASILEGCRYDIELHRRTYARQRYDDLCAQGMIPWRVIYEGTDSAFHRFAVNDMDMWDHVRIPIAEIALEEVIPAKRDTASSFYCVDPCDGWKRVAPCWLLPRHPRP